MVPRAMWSGSVAFDLVSAPIRVAGVVRASWFENGAPGYEERDNPGGEAMLWFLVLVLLLLAIGGGIVVSKLLFFLLVVAIVLALFGAFGRSTV